MHPIYDIRIYLSGPMADKTYDEATEWRNSFKALLSALIAEKLSVDMVKYLDPCDRWYESYSEISKHSRSIVSIDKFEYRSADIVVVNCAEKGWGTPMEMFDAYEHYDKIVLSYVGDQEFPSIWVKEHSTEMFRNWIDIVNWIVQYGHRLK